MSDSKTNGVGHAPFEPSRLLAGRRFVVAGGTGFLGKVWVSMLLHRFPEIDHLWLLVRPKEEQTADERFWSQIVTSAVFDPIREAHPGPEFERFLRAKVTPVAGDLVEPLLGLDERLVESLKGKVDAVVNVAGVVDFNPPLDEALDVNAFGVNNLVALARTLGARVMHTSTCYVAGYRAGLIEEDSPLEVPFPRATGETWYGAACPKRTLDPSHWDPQREIAELNGSIDAVINVAGVVDFNPPLDEAIETNAFGAQNLVSLSKALGNAPLMHTSTCYTVGNRKGLILEEKPGEVHPFPRAEELGKGIWDPAREIADCLDLVKQARHRAEDGFRQSDFQEQ